MTFPQTGAKGQKLLQATLEVKTRKGKGQRYVADPKAPKTLKKAPKAKEGKNARKIPVRISTGIITLDDSRQRRNKVENCNYGFPELKYTIEKALPYLIKRSHDPLFVAASGVLHGGPVTYAHQQKWVERIVQIGDPRSFTDAKRNEEFLNTNPNPFLGHKRHLTRGGSAQMWKGMADRLAQTMKVYIDVCGVKGEACKPDPKVRGLTEKQEEFLKALDNVRGFKGAPKIRALMREYWGEEDAIAVDRHVANWACNDAGIVCPTDGKGNKVTFQKGEPIPDDFFENVADAVRMYADRCGVKPIEMQVAAWMKGACASNAYKPLYLGEGEGGIIQCALFKGGKSATLDQFEVGDDGEVE